MSSISEYKVTLYATIAIGLPSIHANDQKDAFHRAVDSVENSINRLRFSNLPDADSVQYADEISGALVDVVGDTDYAHTVYLNQFGNKVFTENYDCHCSHLELTVAVDNLSIVSRSLGDDWLVRKLRSALDEIRDVAAVIRSRDNEENQDRRERFSK